MSKERIIQLRAAISEHVFLHERLGEYIQRLVAATRPYNPETDWRVHSPSELVERGVDLGASPRAIICWGRLAKVWALLVRRRDEVYPEDIQDLAPLRARPPHLARAARRQPRPHDRRRDQGHHRAGGDPMRTRRQGRAIACDRVRRAARQPDGHHRDRAAASCAGCARSRSAITAACFHGSGFDFVGLRDWQAGDRFSTIDWPQSTPHQLQPADRPRVRAAEHVQRRRRRRRIARRRAAASTACRSPQRWPARSPRIGMSAVFFQDSFGLITFDAAFTDLRGRAAAHRQEPGHSLPRRVSARRGPAGGAARAGA